MANSDGIFRHLRDTVRANAVRRRIDPQRIPAHVAVIMDGNGRWAARRTLPRLEGHRAGAQSIRALIVAATEIGVKYLTLYTFSSENWERPEDEVSGLMDLFREMLAREIDELDEQKVRVRVLGRMDELPEATREAFKAAGSRTAGNERLQLVLALNYGGRREIADAAGRLAQQVATGRRSVESIDADAIAANLYAPDMPDPDLLIRTGGDQRVSNFLLWQIAYSEIWVTRTLWPDFRGPDFLRAVCDFQGRERRFGRVADQD